MTIYLDKYGIIVNLQASDGVVVFRHPTSTHLHGAELHQAEDYTGPVPQLVNYRFCTSKNTLLAKLRLVWEFAKWTFTKNYTTTQPKNAQTPTPSVEL